jgi:hypothetical protein
VLKRWNDQQRESGDGEKPCGVGDENAQNADAGRSHGTIMPQGFAIQNLTGKNDEFSEIKGTQAFI